MPTITKRPAQPKRVRAVTRSAKTTKPSDIWLRLISDREPLSPDVARYFLKFHFLESEHQRMAVLNEKANEGLLTPDERSELEEFIHIGTVLSIMQSRARQSLKKHGQRP